MLGLMEYRHLKMDEGGMSSAKKIDAQMHKYHGQNTLMQLDISSN